MLRKLFLSGTFAFLAIFGTPALMAQEAEATVVVEDFYVTMDPTWFWSFYRNPNIDHSGQSPELAPADPVDASICGHGLYYKTETGNIGARWENSRDGEQIFNNTFMNDTDVTQSFSQEITGIVRSRFDGSLEIKYACARVGVEVEVSLKQTYTVAVPPRSKIDLRANSNLMDRSIEMARVCIDCGSVAERYHNWVIAARGIKEYFKQY